jgi:hypothetical protein
MRMMRTWKRGNQEGKSDNISFLFSAYSYYSELYVNTMCMRVSLLIIP